MKKLILGLGALAALGGLLTGCAREKEALDELNAWAAETPELAGIQFSRPTEGLPTPYIVARGSLTVDDPSQFFAVVNLLETHNEVARRHRLSYISVRLRAQTPQYFIELKDLKAAGPTITEPLADFLDPAIDQLSYGSALSVHRGPAATEEQARDYLSATFFPAVRALSAVTNDKSGDGKFFVTARFNSVHLAGSPDTSTTIFVSAGDFTYDVGRALNRLDELSRATEVFIRDVHFARGNITYLQLGMIKDEAAVDRLVAALRRGGFASVNLQASVPEGFVHGVVDGRSPFPPNSDAEAAFRARIGDTNTTTAAPGDGRE